MSKYHAKKIVIDGETFDSHKEAARYQELKLMQRAGMITELERKTKFELIPNQKRNGRVVERALHYKADFLYKDAETGETVVEDVKGMKTREYIIKRKLMLCEFGIQIRET